MKERVDHNVSDKRDLFIRLAFGTQLRVGISRRCEEEGRETIGDDAIDFLRHRPVKAAQPCFNVSNANPELRGDNGSGHRRVDVTIHHDPVRFLVDENRFESLHYERRLDCVSVGTDAQVEVGRIDS